MPATIRETIAETFHLTGSESAGQEIITKTVVAGTFTEVLKDSFSDRLILVEQLNSKTDYLASGRFRGRF